MDLLILNNALKVGLHIVISDPKHLLPVFLYGTLFFLQGIPKHLVYPLGIPQIFRRPVPPPAPIYRP